MSRAPSKAPPRSAGQSGAWTPQHFPNEQSRAHGACKLSPLASIPSSATAKEAILNTASGEPRHPLNAGRQYPGIDGRGFLGISRRLYFGIGGRHHLGMDGRLPSESAPSAQGLLDDRNVGTICFSLISPAGFKAKPMQIHFFLP